jgi:hypothetical protein
VPAYTVAGRVGSVTRTLTVPPSGPALVQTLTPAVATPSAIHRKAMTTSITTRVLEIIGTPSSRQLPRDLNKKCCRKGKSLDFAELLARGSKKVQVSRLFHTCPFDQDEREISTV